MDISKRDKHVVMIRQEEVEHRDTSDTSYDNIYSIEYLETMLPEELKKITDLKIALSGMLIPERLPVITTAIRKALLGDLKPDLLVVMICGIKRQDRTVTIYKSLFEGLGFHYEEEKEYTGRLSKVLRIVYTPKTEEIPDMGVGGGGIGGTDESGKRKKRIYQRKKAKGPIGNSDEIKEAVAGIHPFLNSIIAYTLHGGGLKPADTILKRYSRSLAKRGVQNHITRRGPDGYDILAIATSDRARSPSHDQYCQLFSSLQHHKRLPKNIHILIVDDFNFDNKPDGVYRAAMENLGYKSAGENLVADHIDRGEKSRTLRFVREDDNEVAEEEVVEEPNDETGDDLPENPKNDDKLNEEVFDHQLIPAKILKEARYFNFCYKCQVTQDEIVIGKDLSGRKVIVEVERDVAFKSPGPKFPTRECFSEYLNFLFEGHVSGVVITSMFEFEDEEDFISFIGDGAVTLLA